MWVLPRRISRTMPQMQGVVQNIIAAWASQSFFSVWITAVGLATAYYLIPKVINRPVFSYNVATIGFAAFIIFAGLTGATRLSGGPVPAWLVTLSIAANIILVIHFVTVGVNLVATMHDKLHMVYHSPTIRFTFFGVVCFLVGSVLGLLGSLRSFDRVLHFTQFATAQTQLTLFLFFSMVIYGAIYYILPRLVGCEWLSSSMITLHFYGAAYGGGMMVAMLLLGGASSGLAFVDPAATFAQIIQIGQVYLPGRSIAWVLFSMVIWFHVASPYAAARCSQQDNHLPIGRRITNESFASTFSWIIISFRCPAALVISAETNQRTQPQYRGGRKIIDIYRQNRGVNAGRVYRSEAKYCHSQQCAICRMALTSSAAGAPQVARLLFDRPPFLGSAAQARPR